MHRLIFNVLFVLTVLLAATVRTATAPPAASGPAATGVERGEASPALAVHGPPVPSPTPSNPRPPTRTPRPTLTPLASPTPGLTPSPTPAPRPLAVALSLELPEQLAASLRVALSRPGAVTAGGEARRLTIAQRTAGADAEIDVGPLEASGQTLAERFYAVVVPFDTPADDVKLTEVRARWQGKGAGPLYITEDAALLSALLGPSAAEVIPADTLLAKLEKDRKAVGILPFDQLDPRFKVLTVDGVNVLSNRLDPARYPLAAAVRVRGKEVATVARLLEGSIGPYTNRAADRLTTLIMTGVTAMSRNTAARMAQKGVLYPALVISDTLAAADITHVSNEVPFLDDCKVNATLNNLVLCSHTSYWKTLKAIGTDIVGLSGNHVNDFGYAGARRSLQFYRDNKIPIYGSGLNIEEACAPLLWEHNGNTFAFIAALAYWPEAAWATDKLPGACYYYHNKARIETMVKELAKKVDVVAVELQYYESYDPFPTPDQVADFREIRDWGADIVTGVQSHVPQAMEPYGTGDRGGPGIIVYGLGNLFFDQMWSWETRTELMARHTIYDGRLLNTEILTGVLEDYAQPRWATAKERAEILDRIFQAAPATPHGRPR